MNEPLPGDALGDHLLAQDGVVSSFNYQEFRMRLEASVRSAKRRAIVVHRAALASLACLVACVASTPLLAYVEEPWWLPVWSGVGLTALLVTGVLAAVDHYRFQPLLQRKQQEMVWAAIDELEAEVANLKENQR